MYVYCVEIMCAGRIGLGWAPDVFIVACHMFMHFSCICTIPFLLIDINCVWNFFCFSLSLSLSFSLFKLVCSWHLKRASLLRLETLFVLGHHFLPLLILPVLMSGSVMIKPVKTFRRTFLDEVFIRKAKSSFQIFPILTFPLSSIVGVRSLFMASQSLVPPWLYKSFTSICTNLITLYLISSLTFEVHAL